MNGENKNCQKCGLEFIITSEDTDFYKKNNLPSPTHCSRCRMIRRQLFRNERVLYKAECKLCGKGIISQYSPGNKYAAYCIDCYASDKWDALSYGVEYDFKKPFFTQFDALMKTVPRRALYHDFTVRSEYVNHSVYVKDCYLCFGGHHYEDSQYCAQNFYVNNCTDVDFSMKSEFCWNSIQLRRCSRVHESAYSENCVDSWFLFGCRNCNNCVGCTNLKNASYHIFNEKYTKEEYEQKLKEFNFRSLTSLEKIKTEFIKKTIQYPRKYAWIRNAVNSTGDDLEQVKECRYCFSATEDENCRYSFFMPTGVKDAYDVDHVGLGTENVCELHSSFGGNRVFFGNRIYYSHDIFYSDDCYNCANLFGCISLRKKEYCIFNKQYTKGEYEALVPKIISHMNAVPYKEQAGVEYKFGEFFPISIMPFAYNETVAQEYFPLVKNDAVSQGFRWRDPEERSYKITMGFADVPDNIDSVSESILQEIIGCAHAGKCNNQCTTAFRVIPSEFQFYKTIGIPLSRLCPNCRHAERLNKLNPMGLFHRSCQCGGVFSQNGVYKNNTAHIHGGEICRNNFETPFSPTRPEIIYCENCYQSETA